MNNDTFYQQIKAKIHESIEKIDFTNPNDILEWFDNTCYYTNMIDMNDTIIKIVQLLRENNYHSFEEITDNDMIYHDNSYSYYLIGQVISNLEVYGFITEPMIEFINIYIENLNMNKTSMQRSKYISFFH